MTASVPGTSATRIPATPRGPNRPVVGTETPATDLALDRLSSAPDVRTALGAALATVKAVAGGRRVVVAALDGRDRITQSAPSGREIEWAATRSILIGRSANSGGGAP